MGLEFSKIPVVVIRECILPFIPDYLDRLHFAMTCKTFWVDMQEIDPVTKAVIQPDEEYGNTLITVASLNHYHSFERIFLNICYFFCRRFSMSNEVLRRCVYVTTCTMILKRIKREMNNSTIFTRALSYSLCKKCETIPNKYMDFFKNSEYHICCGAAEAGNVKVFFDNFSVDLIKKHVKDCLDQTIEHYAAKGGNYDICREIIAFDEHELSLCKQLFNSQKFELLMRLVETEDRLYVICTKLSKRYKDNSYLDFYRNKKQKVSE